MQYHPDKNQDNLSESEIKFKEINEAYSVLKDQSKRNNYDNFAGSGNKTDLFNKAQTLFSQRNFYEALRYLDRVLEIDNNFSYALALKGISLYNLNRSQDALYYLNRTLIIEPNFPQAQQIRMLINNINRRPYNNATGYNRQRAPLLTPMPKWDNSKIFSSILNIFGWVVFSIVRLIFGSFFWIVLLFILA